MRSPFGKNIMGTYKKLKGLDTGVVPTREEQQQILKDSLKDGKSEKPKPSPKPEDPVPSTKLKDSVAKTEIVQEGVKEEVSAEDHKVLNSNMENKSKPFSSILKKRR
ncbi:MAG: hypothetical protein ACRC0G_12615 [Fusobacteriaceae bacterium]